MTTSQDRACAHDGPKVYLEEDSLVLSCPPCGWLQRRGRCMERGTFGRRCPNWTIGPRATACELHALSTLERLGAAHAYRDDH
jgi:hypothetical protein